MPEITSRLSTALAERYQIERHLGEGGMAAELRVCELSSGERMISDCRLTNADWRFDGSTDLQLPIADLKSAITRSSLTVFDRRAKR